MRGFGAADKGLGFRSKTCAGLAGGGGVGCITGLGACGVEFWELGWAGNQGGFPGSCRCLLARQFLWQ